MVAAGLTVSKSPTKATVSPSAISLRAISKTSRAAIGITGEVKGSARLVLAEGGDVGGCGFLDGNRRRLFFRRERRGFDRQQRASGGEFFREVAVEKHSAVTAVDAEQAEEGGHPVSPERRWTETARFRCVRSFRSITSPNIRGVGAWIRMAIGILTFHSLAIRAKSWSAASEWPPSSKNDSSRPMVWMSSSSDQRPTSHFSVAVAGGSEATRVLAVSSGSGKLAAVEFSPFGEFEIVHGRPAGRNGDGRKVGGGVVGK